MTNHEKVFLPDRSLWLTCFGLFLWILGCLCVLWTTLLVIYGETSDWLTWQWVHTSLQDNKIPSIVLYTLAAIVFFISAVGTHRARRWARTMILTFSWIWISFGLINMIATIILTISSSQTEFSSLIYAIGFMILINVIHFALLPTMFILFYNDLSIKATFNARNRPRHRVHIHPIPILMFPSFRNSGKNPVRVTVRRGKSKHFR